MNFGISKKLFNFVFIFCIIVIALCVVSIEVPVVAQEPMSDRVIVYTPALLGAKVKITGNTPAGAGKKVMLLVVSKGALVDDLTAVQYIEQGKSKSDGSFEFTYSMRDKDKLGRNTDGVYQVYVKSDGALRSQPIEYLYVSEVVRKKVIDDINSAIKNKMGSIQIKNTILTDLANRNALMIQGLYMDEYDKLDSVKKDEICLKVYNGKPEEDYFADTLKSVFNDAVVLARLCQVDNRTDFLALLDLFQNDVLLLSSYDNKNFDQFLLSDPIRDWVADILFSKKQNFDQLEVVRLNFKIAVMLYKINHADLGTMEEVIASNYQRLNLDNDELYKFYINTTDNGKIFIHKKLIYQINEGGKPFSSTMEFIQFFDIEVNEWKIEAAKIEQKKDIGNSSGGSRRESTIISVDAQPLPPTEAIFIDIDNVPWAKESIEELAKNNIISREVGKAFRPNDNIKREEFLKIVISAFELTNPNADCDFKDVDKNAWYYPFVSSAKTLGITQGLGNNSFGIGTEITRQEMATILYRVVIHKNLRLIQKVAEEDFVDKQNIDDYAKLSVSELQKADLINGMDGNRFAPFELCTRAQAAKVIYGIMQKSRL